MKNTKPHKLFSKLLMTLKVAGRLKLATLAKTTPGSLRQYAEGRRKVSPEIAIRIEKAARQMGVEISRADLSATCGKCEFAKACLSRKTVKVVR